MLKNVILDVVVKNELAIVLTSDFVNPFSPTFIIVFIRGNGSRKMVYNATSWHFDVMDFQAPTLLLRDNKTFITFDIRTDVKVSNVSRF